MILSNDDNIDTDSDDSNDYCYSEEDEEDE